MKKILFAAMMLAAFVGCKNAEKQNVEGAEAEAAVVEETVVGDVVYVQVEAVLVSHCVTRPRRLKRAGQPRSRNCRMRW